MLRAAALQRAVAEVHARQRNHSRHDIVLYMVLCFTLLSLCYVILALRMEPSLGYGVTDARARGLAPSLEGV